MSNKDWKKSLALIHSQIKPLEPRELERQVHIEQVAIEHEELVEHILTGPPRDYSARTPAVIRREWAGRPRPRKKQRYLTCICRAPTVAPWSFCDDCLRQAEVGPYRPPRTSLEDDTPKSRDQRQRPPQRREYTSIFEDGGIPLGSLKPKQSINREEATMAPGTIRSRNHTHCLALCMNGPEPKHRPEDVPPLRHHKEP